MDDRLQRIIDPADMRMIRCKSLTCNELRIGASETRTRDLLHAMQTRSQLRHGPALL